MEKLTEYLKNNFFVNYENPEIKSIEDAVLKFLNKVKDVFPCIDDNKIKINKLIPTGSMAEKTKVWPMTTSKNMELEFDYLVEIEPWFRNQKYTAGCNGFMKVCDESKEVSIYDLTKVYSDTLFQTIAQICTTCCRRYEETFKDTDDEDCNVKEVRCSLDDSHDDPVTHNCFVETEFGRLQFVRYDNQGFYELHFMWFSKTQKIRFPYMNEDNIIRFTSCDSFSVNVDFLPGYNMGSDLDKTSVYLVPKKCHNSHDNCWKISRCLQEIRMIQDSREHRYIYMVLKLLFQIILLTDMRDEWLVLSLLPSYRIKTAVLHHIKTCRAGKDIKVDCLDKILTYFAKCVEDGEIVHWYEDYSLDIGFIDKENGSVFLKYLCHLLKSSNAEREFYLGSVNIEEICGKSLANYAREVASGMDSVVKFLNELRRAALDLKKHKQTPKEQHVEGFECF